MEGGNFSWKYCRCFFFFLGGIDPLSVEGRREKHDLYIYTPLEKNHILLYKLHKLTLTCVLFFMANQPTPPKYPPANKDLLRAYKPLDSFGEAFLNPCFAGMFPQVSKKTISYHQIQIIIRIPYFESKDFCLVEGRLISTASTIGI